MSATIEQIRIAITVFDDPERLWGAVLALLRNGLSSTQLCLLARESSLAGACNAYLQNSPKEDRQHVAALCERVEDLPCERRERIVATGRSLLVSLLGTRASCDNHAPVALILSHDTTDLDNEIEQGLVALIAKSSDPRQQSIVTRTLLNRSVHRVTTCEFAAKTAVSSHVGSA